MKFGKELRQQALAQERCRNFYLSYKELKRAIKAAKAPGQGDASGTARLRLTGKALRSSASGDRAEDVIVDLLRRELDKINSFVELQWEVISSELKTRLRNATSSGADPISVEALDRIAEDIIFLDGFVRINYVGVRKICKKCDKQLRTTFLAWFMPRVEKATFRQRDFGTLLDHLGCLYALWRKHGGAVVSGQDEDDLISARHLRSASPRARPGEAFLVAPAELARTKVQLLRRLHPGTPGTGLTGVRPAEGSPDSATSPQGQRRRRGPGRSAQDMVGADFRVPASSLYFDNRRGDQYTERYRRRLGVAAEGGDASASEGRASPVVFRCHAAGDGRVAEETEASRVEVEVEGGASAEARAARLRLRDWPTFAAGRLGAGGGDLVLQEAQAAIASGQLRPLVSASFRRWTFTEEAAGSAGAGEVAGRDLEGFLATLDEDLVFFAEDAATSTGSGGSWCRAAREGGARPGDAPPSAAEGRVSVPHAVLRVHAPAGQSSARLLKGLGLTPQQAPGYSKGVHGVALLHGERASPPPPWLSLVGQLAIPAMARTPTDELATDAGATEEAAGHGAEAPRAPGGPLAPPPAAEPALGHGEGRRSQRWGALASHAAAVQAWAQRLAAPITGGGPPRVDDPELRVDMKTLLASERTILRWLRSAILLSTLSAYLTSQDGDAARLNGFLLALVATLFSIWPAMAFYRRSVDMAAESPTAPEEAWRNRPLTEKTMPQALALSLGFVLLAVLAVHCLFGGRATQF